MFHRKRFRQAAVFPLTLLLTVVLASISLAQESSPPPLGGPASATPASEETTNPPAGGNGNPTATATPTTGGGPPDPGGSPTPMATTLPPDGGNGGNGGMMMSASWPPPNSIVHHAATPIQISSLGGGLQVYLIGPDGMGQSGPLLGSISSLAEMHPSGGAVELYRGTNPASGKPVTIHYLPDAMKIHVSTFYADKPPHDYNKPYIFTVDADHSVTHEAW